MADTDLLPTATMGRVPVPSTRRYGTRRPGIIPAGIGYPAVHVLYAA
jgi:hypothetical protein